MKYTDIWYLFILKRLPKSESKLNHHTGNITKRRYNYSNSGVLLANAWWSVTLANSQWARTGLHNGKEKYTHFDKNYNYGKSDLFQLQVGKTFYQLKSYWLKV